MLKTYSKNRVLYSEIWLRYGIHDFNLNPKYDRKTNSIEQTK